MKATGAFKFLTYWWRQLAFSRASCCCNGKYVRIAPSIRMVWHMTQTRCQIQREKRVMKVRKGNCLPLSGVSHILSSAPDTSVQEKETEWCEETFGDPLSVVFIRPRQMCFWGDVSLGLTGCAGRSADQNCRHFSQSTTVCCVLRRIDHGEDDIEAQIPANLPEWDNPGCASKAHLCVALQLRACSGDRNKEKKTFLVEKKMSAPEGRNLLRSRPCTDRVPRDDASYVFSWMASGILGTFSFKV